MPYYNQTPGQGNDSAASFILVILAIFFPPAVPLLISGCGPDFCINCLLTILAWFPGCLHALWIIYRQAKANENRAASGFIYAGHGQYQPAQEGQHPAYGATAPPPPPPPPQHHHVPPQSGAYVPGREPWEGQQQQQQQQQAAPAYTKQ